MSEEGKKWKDVECGRTYDANQDQATLVGGLIVESFQSIINNSNDR